MPIDPLPSISRSDPDFRVKVDDYFLTRLPTFSTQAEAARVQIVAAESAATSAASTATTAASTATAAASGASSSASSANTSANSAVTAKNAAEAAAAAAATFDPANYLAKAGATLTGALNFAAPVTIASAATTNIAGAASNNIIITGTTGITGFGTIAAGATRRLTFTGILALNHNSTSMILPGGVSKITAAGDVAEFVSLGSGNWRCTSYSPATGVVSYSAQGKIAGSLIAESDPDGSIAFTARNTGSGINSAAELNAAYGASAIGGVKAANGYVEVGSGTNTPVHFVVGSSRRATLDTSGNLLVTGGALGYGVGAGATVVQETSKSTTVALNKPSGRITMNNASLAAGGTAFFLLNNTAFDLGDLCIAHIYGSSTAGNYEVFAYTNTLNQVGFKVRNISAGALAENVIISFAIIKGSTS